MIRLISLFALAGTFAAPALAQTISAQEGDWIWNAELDVNGLKITNSGSTCVTPETTEIDLPGLLLGLNETCSISDWNEGADTIHFSLSCLGEHAANMSGEIALGEGDASITLAGAIRLGDSGPITTIINGKAAHTGVCLTPEGAAEPLQVAELAADETAEDVAPAIVSLAPTEVAALPEDADISELTLTDAEAIEAEPAGELTGTSEVPKAAPVAPIEVTALSDEVAAAVSEGETLDASQEEASNTEANQAEAGEQDI